MKFRKLNKDEIDCRIATVSEKGLSLLLYKDARVDMRILDETVGVEYWQRKHELINGNLFCSVGIFCGEQQEWVWKQDVGVESYTEKEKGQASDSFKRACFNWGIGRELYSAPFIWISADKCNLFSKNGKTTCNDRFSVTNIGYDLNGNIDILAIRNDSRKQIVFTMGQQKAQQHPDEDAGLIGEIKAIMKQKGYSFGAKAQAQLEAMDIEALKETLQKTKNLPDKGANV